MLIMEEKKKNMRLKDRLLSGVFDMVKPIEDRAAQEYPKLLAFEKEMQGYMSEGHAILFGDILHAWDPREIPRVGRIKPAEPVYGIEDMINWVNINMSSSVHSYRLDKQLRSMQLITYFYGPSAIGIGGYLLVSGVYDFVHGVGLSYAGNIAPDHILEKECWNLVEKQLDQNGMPSTQSDAEHLAQQGKIVIGRDGTVLFPENQMDARQSINAAKPVICAPDDVRDDILSSASVSAVSGGVCAMIAVAAISLGVKNLFRQCAGIKKISILKDVFDHNAKVFGDVLSRSGGIEIRIYNFGLNNVADRSPKP